MFLPINNVPALAISVIDGGEKGYKDTFVHFQTAGNQQSEEKVNACNYLLILVLKTSKLSYSQTILT